jgi:mRNA interferase MazF
VGQQRGSKNSRRGHAGRPSRFDEVVDVREESGRMVIEPTRQKTWDLDELLRGITRRYVPHSGDVVWLNFTPQVSREQAGHRPALVLSPASYNEKTGLMVCCTMTTQIKNYPFEVLIAGTPPSAVLSNQIKSLDWRNRNPARKGAVSRVELAEVRAKILALIG